MSRIWYLARVLAAFGAILGNSSLSGRRPEAAAAPREGEVQSDPIRCWWKADRTAVRVGERFGLVLTCAVIEAGPITVVPVLNQLEPGALSITPFEVVSGARGDDMVAPPWRYVQFDYSVRLLSDGFFGQDVMIPGVTVTYNLQTAGGTQGRDQTYMLPALPMRILSLVPRSASDIRDASGQTFASIASRRFRSSLARVLAWVSFAFAAVLAIFALVRAIGHFRSKSAVAVRKLPVPSVLGGCLDAIRRRRRRMRRGPAGRLILRAARLRRCASPAPWHSIVLWRRTSSARCRRARRTGDRPERVDQAPRVSCCRHRSRRK